MKRRVGGSALLVLGLFAYSPPGQVRVHIVQLGNNRFVPAVIEVIPGDSLRLTNGAGGPHNLEFEADSIPEAARKALAQAMPGDKLGPLSSPLLIITGETYGFRIPELPPGRYPFVCLPHVAGNMRGALVVVRQ